MSIEGQGHFFTIYFPDFVCFVSTRPRYQVSVYRTIGPLVYGNIKNYIVIVRGIPGIYNFKSRASLSCLMHSYT